MDTLERQMLRVELNGIRETLERLNFDKDEISADLDALFARLKSLDSRIPAERQEKEHIKKKIDAWKEERARIGGDISRLINRREQIKYQLSDISERLRYRP